MFKIFFFYKFKRKPKLYVPSHIWIDILIEKMMMQSIVIQNIEFQVFCSY